MMNNTKRYVIFSRRWWKDNPDWPTGREPHLGRKKFIAWAQYEDDARTICKEWTERFKNKHPRVYEKYSVKAEYTLTENLRGTRMLGLAGRNSL